MDMLSSSGCFLSCGALLDLLLNLRGRLNNGHLMTGMRGAHFFFFAEFASEHGIAASWETECGGVRQLRVLDQTGRPMKISELIQAGVLKGAEVPVGF